METIEFRSARPADAKVVADYHQRCFEKTYNKQLLAGELQAPSLEGTRQQLHGWFQPGSGFKTQVAVIDGTPIGHFTTKDHQLVHLFLEPAHHGTGLGRKMLDLGEQEIARDGHFELELHARTDNVAAIAFYKNAGWTVTDRLIHTDEHGISYDEHILVKHRPRSGSS